MDLNQDSPIVIHSDDDDDDDVVLVEDRSAENDDKKHEDDVIFISEEQPSLSRQKCSPESRKNKRKVAMLSNASGSDVDACNIQCDGYFPSDFSSISLINDLLRPLDLSHGSTLGSGDLPAEIKCRLNLLKQLQDSCSSVSSPEQDGNNSNKSDDDDLDDSVKVLHDFDVGSGRNVGDSTFASTSGKLEILAPLKLPESTGPLSSQDLTASVCKLYVEKNCFNLPLTEAKDVATLASDLVNASSSASLSCLDKTAFHTMGQDVGANVFDDSASKKNSMLKSITAVSVNSSNYTQSLGGTSALCDVNNLGFTSSNSEALTKGICTVVDPLICLKNPGQPHDTATASRNFYIGDTTMSKPGTSKQYSNLVSRSASLLDMSDSSSAAQSNASSSGSDSSLNLAFDNLTSEDFNTLLDFFADGDRSQAPSDPAAGSKGSDDPGLSNVTDLLGAASDNQATLSRYGDPLVLRSPASALYDHSYNTKSNKQTQDDIDCKFNSGVDYLTKTLQEPSMPDFSTTDYSCLVVNADKAGTERSSSSDLQRHPSQANISFSSVSGAFRKFLSQRIRALGSKRGAFHINMMNLSKKSKSKFHLSNIGINSQHQGTDPVKTLTHDDGILQASDHLNTGTGNVSSGQWQIVRSVPSSTRKRKVNDNLVDSPPSARKKKQGEENLGKEKPSLKIRLKLSHSVSGLEANVPAPFRPSTIGLKKSIMKRHASMIGDITDADVKPRSAGIHRSVSDGGLIEQSDESKITEVPCVACSKMVNGKKLSQCSKGHGICAACLEPQVKSVLKGDVKQKNITCLFYSCSEIVSFGELKQTFPSLVVDILEEKLDKEYLSYITKWMFTDEQLKSRSEFATLDTKVPPRAASGLKKCEEMDSQEAAHEPVEDFPRFWLSMEPSAPVMAFEVIPDTEEYRALACQFHETLSFGDYDIVRIVRIQNPILWKYFSLKQSEMIQEDDGMGVTEKRLYHGTHRSTCEAIARKGFDWRLSGKHGTVYGNGSYFATTSRYSHAYTDRAGSGISVKAGGSSLGSFFQSSTTLTYPGFNSTSINQRVIKPSRFTSMTHTALMSSVPPLQLTSSSSQGQPPQPPPAHYHYPAPPPAHGQTSSLQVPAHLPMVNPGSTKDSSLSGMPASCARTSSCNAPLVKILPKPPLTAPSSTGPPNTVISNNCAHYFNPSNIFCMPPPFAQPHFTSDFQTRTSTTDPSNSASSQSLNPNGQLVFGGRSSYTAPSMPKPGFSTAASSAFSWRDLINPAGSGQDRPTVGTRNHKSKYQDGSKSNISSYLQAPLKGTNDLSSVFSCDPSSKTHFMFVARVLVGRHTLGKAGLKRPPPLNENDPYGKCFDSCVDDMFCPQLYVIFDSNQAYPEYVIEYNWHKE